MAEPGFKSGFLAAKRPLLLAINCDFRCEDLYHIFEDPRQKLGEKIEKRLSAWGMKYKLESLESAVPSQTASPAPPGVELLEPSLPIKVSRDASRSLTSVTWHLLWGPIHLSWLSWPTLTWPAKMLDITLWDLIQIPYFCSVNIIDPFKVDTFTGENWKATQRSTCFLSTYTFYSLMKS